MAGPLPSQIRGYSVATDQDAAEGRSGKTNTVCGLNAWREGDLVDPRRTQLRDVRS